MGGGIVDLVRAIKQIVQDTVDNMSISDMVYGTYTGNSLKIDNKPLPIPMDMVDIPERLRVMPAKVSFEITDTDAEGVFEVRGMDDEIIPIKSIKFENVPVNLKINFSPGDRVAVVQKKGGQRYAVIDRMG